MFAHLKRRVASNAVRYVREIGIWSPKDGIGKTTMAVLLGLELSKSGLTAILDLSRYPSALPYMARYLGKRGLKAAYDSMDDELALQQFVQWGDKPLFHLGMSVHDKLDDLYRFSSERVSELIKLAKNHFDHVIIIIPSDYIESGFIAGIGSHPARLLSVIDEDIATWYRYGCYRKYFDDVGLSLPLEMVIVNQWRGILDIEGLAESESHSVSHMTRFPWLKEMTDMRNRGEMNVDRWLLGKEMRLAKTGLADIMDFITLEVAYGRDSG